MGPLAAADLAAEALLVAATSALRAADRGAQNCHHDPPPVGGLGTRLYSETVDAAEPRGI